VEGDVTVEHTLEIVAACPVDGRPDVYRCVVRATKTVRVEDILAATKAFHRKKVFQEDLTQELHRNLGCEVETVGWHSGVETRVVCR
jgi:NADPH-dependent 7-cyano-7-deazaguanine reductase QueF